MDISIENIYSIFLIEKEIQSNNITKNKLEKILDSRKKLHSKIGLFLKEAGSLLEEEYSIEKIFLN
jgi:hypothetical protein